VSAPLHDKRRRLIDRTSGLDASIALSVMQVLRDIASTGRTVIGTSAAWILACILTWQLPSINLEVIFGN
jgi:ABC-type ATPase involved in cell division